MADQLRGAIGQVPYLIERGGFDEAMAADGTLRESWTAIARSFGTLSAGELADRQRRIDRLLDAEGAGHLVHDLAVADVGMAPSTESRPWRLDPVPLVLAGAEFDGLAAAAAQRLELFEALLRDVYDARTLIRDSVIPASVLFALESLNTTAAARHPPRWLVHYAMDVVRTAAGQWRVVADHIDTPPGLGYLLMNRTVMARVSGQPLRHAAVAPVADAATVLRLALASCAASAAPSARTVVMTAGATDPTYVEHSYLALQMGFHLAETADLVVRKNRLWLRALEALEPVDVVYRRVADDALDPLEMTGRRGRGVPAVAWAAQRGGVVVANAVGARVAEEAALTPFLADAAEALGLGALRVAALRDDDRLATAPALTGPATAPIAPARVVIRVHAIAGADGAVVVRGGVGRVLADDDDPRHPTQRLVKDVWVVGDAQAPRGAVRGVVPAQVDLRASVTTRAAQAMFWMGRAAERAEVAARTAQWIGTQLDEDPGLVGVGAGGGWATGALALLRAARALPLGVSDEAGAPFAERIGLELEATKRDVAVRLAAVVHEATSVREYLSLSTGRLLGRFARLHVDLLADRATGEELDLVLTDLAALSGLWTESTVRGPSWRFLDIGRRLERALVVLGSIEAALGTAVDAAAFQPVAEAALAINDSLVAYRRRYRSDVDLSALLDLLVHDDGNPRGLAFQLDRLREDLASLQWSAGVDLVQSAALGALTDVDRTIVDGRRMSVDALVLAARAPLLSLAAAVVERWFAVPVNPTLVRGR